MKPTGDHESQTKRCKQNLKAPSEIKRLTKMRDLLTKVSKNVAKPFTYIDMRQIRKEYIELTRANVSFTSSERRLSENVSRLLTMLREARPELFSKQDFLRTSKLQVAKVNPIDTSAHCQIKKMTKLNPGPSRMLRSSQVSVSTQLNSDIEIPATLSENFVAPTPGGMQSAASQIATPEIDTQDMPLSEIPSSIVQKPTSVNVRGIMRTSRQHDSPLVAAASTVNEVNVEDEVKQYKLWAIELRDVLKKQQKQGQARRK